MFKGFDGLDGDKGNKGLNGEQGPSGIHGDKGNKGLLGKNLKYEIQSNDGIIIRLDFFILEMRKRRPFSS